jgi:alpha-L-fucosidase
MAGSRESILGTQPGLEPWQFYGPSTRRDNRVYLHLLARPYDTISVRAVHLRKIKAASVLASGEQLRIHRRGVVSETMFNQDPVGELIIDVPENAIAPLQTVIALDLEP